MRFDENRAHFEENGANFEEKRPILHVFPCFLKLRLLAPPSGALVVSQFQDPVQSSPDDMLLLLLVHFRLFTIEMEGSSSLSVNNIVSHTPVSKFLLICLCCRCVDRYISGFTFEKAAVSPSILSILPILPI